MKFKDVVQGGRFIELLEETGREGMGDLIAWLFSSGFFLSPASTQYHGAYEGGLMDHSWNVFDRLVDLDARFNGAQTPRESLIIAALLHDVCKAGAYVASETAKSGFAWNKEHPKGHAVLSVDIVSRFIALSDLEEKMIRYHMGVYGLIEYDERSGEYPLRGGGLANAWHHHKAVKLMYFADELATMDEQLREAGQ